MKLVHISCLLLIGLVQSSLANETLLVGEHTYSQMSSGGIGLIQTPTARMANDGDISLNYTDLDTYRFWSVNLQLFPWMESTVRYTDVRNRLFSNDVDFSGDQTLKDKGIDVKFRLFEESHYTPETSIGFRDFGGTGLFESEFISVSKRFGNLDFNLGLGWGNLGTSGNVRNPFCSLKDSLCTRPDGFSGRGGSVEFGHFFRGPAALFGGIEYKTPLQGLTLKAEYDGNDYSMEADPDIEQDSPWNFAATYSYDNLNFTFSYVRGNTLGLSLSYRFNLHTVTQEKAHNPPRPIREDRQEFPLSNVNGTELVQELYDNAGFATWASSHQDNEFTLYGSQLAYRDKHESIQRVGRILIDTLPSQIESIKVVENVNNLPVLETQIDVQAFSEAANYERLEANIEASYTRQDTSEDTLEQYKPISDSGFYANLETYWSQTFGSPEKFYFYQGGLVFSTGYVFNRNWDLMANLEATLLDNYDDFNFTQDPQQSSLPRVRTQIREYVSDNTVTLDSLYLNWKDRVAPNLYASTYAGYLETMYGGIGGEILYHPVDSELAFGVDINYVKQRDSDDPFSFLDYDAFTGHVNLYWQPNYLKGIQFTVNVGQFLAKDRGVNIDFAKKFDSGIIVGAYAAFTNVSAEEYGEGSFTKGFYMTIPFDLFTTRPSKGNGFIPWAPIARDGGQMLHRPSQLYDMTKIRGQF